MLRSDTTTHQIDYAFKVFKASFSCCTTIQGVQNLVACQRRDKAKDQAIRCSLRQPSRQSMRLCFTYARLRRVLAPRSSQHLPVRSRRQHVPKALFAKPISWSDSAAQNTSGDAASDALFDFSGLLAASLQTFVRERQDYTPMLERNDLATSVLLFNPQNIHNFQKRPSLNAKSTQKCDSNCTLPELKCRVYVWTSHQSADLHLLTAPWE